MLYDSIEVAKFLVSYAASMGHQFSVTKTQKLLYIMYGLWLAKKNERLLEEYPQAWQFGPVFPRTGTKKTRYLYEGTIPLEQVSPELRENKDLERLIDLTIRKFGHFSASKLVAWSHEKNSPWDKVKKETDSSWSVQIPDQYTKEYFLEYVDSYDFTAA